VRSLRDRSIASSVQGVSCSRSGEAARARGEQNVTNKGAAITCQVWSQSEPLRNSRVTQPLQSLYVGGVQCEDFMARIRVGSLEHIAL
jgi:hypothetical protein